MNAVTSEGSRARPFASWWQFALPPQRRARFCGRLAAVPAPELHWLLLGLYVQDGLTVLPLIGPRDGLAEALEAVHALPPSARLVADHRTCRLMMRWGFQLGPYRLLRRHALRLVPGADFRERHRFREGLARATLTPRGPETETATR